MNTMSSQSAKEMPEKQPAIWHYRDARSLVSDLCDWKKQHERGFSFRKLARLADFGSPNYIQTYLAGKKNLTPGSAGKLADALGMDQDQTQFLQALCGLELARDPDEKRRWYQELLAVAARHSTNRIDAARLSYFMHWYIPVVHAMASLAQFRFDPDWISMHIVPAIGKREAQSALATLQDLGIFAKSREGTWTVHEPRLATDDALRSIWIREYHRAMIELSLRALDTWPANMRSNGAMTVTVPTDDVPTVLTWVDEIRQELFTRILALQEAQKGVDGDVMQVNFQIFPLTRTNQKDRKV